MKLHHIGYYVKDMDAAIKSFLRLGGAVRQPPMFDASRHVNIAFLSTGGGLLELVEPAAECTLFRNRKQWRESKPYHICYEVEDMDMELKNMQEKGALIIQPPMPAPAIDNRNVAFVYDSEIGLIELVEA